MKKLGLVVIILLSGSIVFSQKVFSTKFGQIKFFSNTALEDVEAINNQVFCSLNSVSGKIQFAVLIKGFAFENALMQKHFNDEEYMHSNKFPKAIFTGNMKNFALINFTKNGTYKVNVNGILSLHGITKSIVISGVLIIKEGQIQAKSSFNIKPKDYNITVPEGISNTIAVAVECKLQ